MWFIEYDCCFTSCYFPAKQCLSTKSTLVDCPVITPTSCLVIWSFSMSLPFQLATLNTLKSKRCDSDKESCSSAGDLGLISSLGRPPQEGNGNHSSITWRIPWTGEPGNLQSMGSRRVGHNWETNTTIHWKSLVESEREKLYLNLFFPKMSIKVFPLYDINY